LCFVDGHCKGDSHRKVQSLNLKGTSVGIIGMRSNSTSSHLNYSFKIVVSIMLFINFFTEILVDLCFVKE